VQPNETSSPPFFIVSSPRSGSTLLRLLLTAHPALCIPPESKFLVRLHERFGAKASLDPAALAEFVTHLYRDKKFSEWGIPEDLLREKLFSAAPLGFPAAVTMVYRTYMEKTWTEARIWGDKNPGYRRHIPTILSVYPEAKIIHLLRDVRAVYLSMKNVALKNGKRPLGKIARATQKWQMAIHEIRRHERPAQFLTIRYEDLVTETEATLTRACEFLGVNFDARMLEFYADNAARGLVPQNRLAKHANTLKPVTTQRMNAWQSELDRIEIEAIEYRNRALMDELGYPPVTHGLTLRSAGRLAVDFLEGLAAPVYSTFVRKSEDEDDEDEGTSESKTGESRSAIPG